SETPVMCGNTLRENREGPCSPAGMAQQVVSGSLRTHADDARTWEVGRSRSTREALEQNRATGGGEGGGKGIGQRETASANHAPDSGLGERATSAAADTSSCEDRSKNAVHLADAPHL